MQNQYSLMQRRTSGDAGLLADQGVGSLPWSPLGGAGWPARDEHTTRRAEIDPLQARYVGRERADRQRRATSPKPAGADGPGALAWVLRNRRSPRSWARPPHHLPDAVAALDLQLSEEEVRALEEPYTPRLPVGF